LRGGVRSTEAPGPGFEGESSAASAEVAAAPKGDDAGACLAEDGGVDEVLPPPPFHDAIWSTILWQSLFV